MATSFTIPAETLLAIVKDLARHASHGDKSVISGIHVSIKDDGKIELAATDGYRLAVADVTRHKIDGHYPNYRQIMPRATIGVATFNGKAMLAALKAMPVDKVKGNAVTVTMNGSITLEAEGTRSSIPGAVDHLPGSDEDVMTFNRDYLMDSIKAALAVDWHGSGDVVLRFNGPCQAAVVTSVAVDPCVQSLVMPIRS